MNYDFTDKELGTLQYITDRVISFNMMNPENSPNKFSLSGTFKLFYSLQEKGVMHTKFKPSYVNPILSNKHYWWYLTDKGIDLINEMITMRDL